MKFASKQIVSATAISGTGVVTSAAIPLDLLIGYAVVLTTTGAATGSAKLQATVDGLVWVDLPDTGATANATVSGAGDKLWNVSDAFYKAVRIIYTNASNSGTLSISFYAKST